MASRANWRGLVGGDRGRLEAHGREFVRAGQHHLDHERHDAAPHRVRPGVDHHLHVQAEQVTVVTDGGTDVEALLAGLPGRGEVLAAVLDPLDRPAESVGCGRDGEFLPGGTDLQAERAADIARQHAHLVPLDAEARGDTRPGDVHALGRRVKGQDA
jgi:hypothetical protein